MGASTSPESDKHQPIDSVYEGAQASTSPPVQPTQGGGSSSPPTADTKRKRHVKSRTGCYNCKKRKVKCNEHWPECYNCKRLRMVCEYPWAPPPAAKQHRTTTTTDRAGGGNLHTHHHQCCIHGHHDGMSRGSIGSESGTSTGGGVMMPYDNGYRISSPSAPLRTTPTVLTIEDLRFYHQFMTVGFPSFQSKNVWEQCASMSSHVSCFSSHDLVVHPYHHSPRPLPVLTCITVRMSRTFHPRPRRLSSHANQRRQSRLHGPSPTAPPRRHQTHQQQTLGAETLWGQRRRRRCSLRVVRLPHLPVQSDARRPFGLAHVVPRVGGVGGGGH